MKSITKFDMTVNFISKVCLSLVGLISLFGLYFWIINQSTVENFEGISIPMAPSTAMFFILFTLDLAFKQKINGNKVARFFEKVIIISISVISISIVSEKIFGFSHEIEYFLSDNNDMYLGAQLWKMSPITGICFALIALSLQLKLFLRSNEIADKIFTIIHLVIGSIAGTIIIGYGYKTPFLYGGTIIPVALSTGICFFLLSIATTTSFGSNTKIIKALNGSTVTSNLIRTIVPITLFGLIVLGLIDITTNYELFNHASISAITLIATIIILNGAIIFASRKIGLIIDIETRKRIFSEQELKKLNKSLKVTNSQLKEEIDMRMKIEEELRVATDKAETANKAKSQFLANMSHEIRTPMNGILGMAQLLGMRLQGEQKEMSDNIKSSGEKLINIINDILDISKIEAGKVRLNQEEFDINVVISEVNNVIKILADQKRLEYKSYIDKEIRGHLIGDSERLRQVLLNILGNAIKFTENGSIELSVAKVKIFEDKMQLLFSIKDTGIGIAEDKIRQLFTAFVQGDNTFTKKYGGTGLGLAISKHLINMMGGEISVESKSGVGSNFSFSSIFKVEVAANELHEID